MPAFQDVTKTDFAAAIAASGASKAFRHDYARFEPLTYEGRAGSGFTIVRGDVIVTGHWRAPGFHTLVLGDVVVDGLVDLSNAYNEGYDEGGQFVVIGDVRCRGFVNEGGKSVFIDGDLAASDCIVTNFCDSGLQVVGDLRTRFFLGDDIHAGVGGQVSMEAGDGYCMPLAGGDYETQAIRPRLGVAESFRLLKRSLYEEEIDDDAISWFTGLKDDIRASMASGEGVFAERENIEAGH